MYYREWDISLDTADTGFKPTRILTSSVAHLAVLLVQPLVFMGVHGGRENSEVVFSFLIGP